MIRVLLIGSEAAAWATRLRSAASSADFESARLPAAAIRAFEKSPADVIVLCGDSDTARHADVLEALRSRPLGRLVPCVSIGDDELQVDANLDISAEPSAVLQVLGELLGVDANEWGEDEIVGARPASVTENEIERKLRQVRHETYFDVLEIDPDASPASLRDAFARLCERFASQWVPDELGQRFDAELAEVRDGIEDAYAVLGNEKLRAAYTDVRRTR